MRRWRGEEISGRRRGSLLNLKLNVKWKKRKRGRQVDKSEVNRKEKGEAGGYHKGCLSALLFILSRHKVALLAEVV